MCERAQAQKQKRMTPVKVQQREQTGQESHMPNMRGVSVRRSSGVSEAHVDNELWCVHTACA